MAEILHDWIKRVIPGIQPWISTQVDQGALWFNETTNKLKDAPAGIVCLSQENKDRPWILFEAGALATSQSSKLCILLTDLQPPDLKDPLAQFQCTLPTESSMWALVKTLNGQLGSASHNEELLELFFKKCWPQFEKEFASALNNTSSEKMNEQRSGEEMLIEILGGSFKTRDC